jgi:phage shock protein PspC (stress-responsive transcriptional regulator)
MKELTRSRTDRMIAGVCGGIGRYLDVDSNLIRLIWGVVTIFSVGTGLLAYLIAWLIIPEEAPPTATPQQPETGAVIDIEPTEVR